MSKSSIICAKSGITFSCEFLPLSLGKNSMMHPFFFVPQKVLLSNADKWANMEFGREETYLYFLSLLDSSGLLIWRKHATLNDDTFALATAHMEKLLLVIERMTRVNQVTFARLPQYTITEETCLLESIPHYLDSWNDAIDEAINGYKSVGEIYAEQEQENSISRLIKSPYRTNDRELAGKIAKWADNAGKFPKFLTEAPNGKKIPLNELWKEIIKACVDDDRIHHIPRTDLEELIEHVIDHIPQGTIHAQKLLQFLRTALNKKADMISLGFGSENLAGKTTSFTIIRKETERAGALLNTLISQAPTKEPKRGEFDSLADFLKAKAKWNLAAPTQGSMVDEVKKELQSFIVDDRADFDPDFYPTDEDMN